MNENLHRTLRNLGLLRSVQRILRPMDDYQAEAYLCSLNFAFHINPDTGEWLEMETRPFDE